MKLSEKWTGVRNYIDIEVLFDLLGVLPHSLPPIHFYRCERFGSFRKNVKIRGTKNEKDKIFLK
jgi:hypothetical protein